MFDWAELASVTASFANAVAVTYAAWLAKSGLNQWHKERVHTRQAELAEQALALLYRAQEVFDSVRSAWGFHGEGSSRQREENETDEERSARDRIFVPIERLNHYSSFFDEIINIRANFRAAFGKSAALPLDEILRLRANLISHVRMRNVLLNRTHFRSQTDREKNLEKQQEHEAWYWKGTADPDPVDPRVEAAIQKLEQLVEPILESNFRLKDKE